MKKKTLTAVHLSILLLILISTIICGFALTRYGPTHFDSSILFWFRRNHDLAHIAGPDWATHFWLGLSWLGNKTPRTIVTIVAILGLFLFHRRHSAQLITGVLFSGMALTEILKYWVARPRPQLVPHLDHASSQSFPSGHTLNSTLFYLTMAIIIISMVPQKLLRWALYLAAVILSLAAGLSRIALGVHWPSDIIASWIIASVWLGLWLLLAKHYWPKALP